MKERVDKELEEFRSLMAVPSTFEEGFSWTALLGAVFVALLMVPGAIYMGLLAGQAEVGPAATWVTVILFIEIAKRAHKTLKRAEIFVLFFMASAAMGLPFSGLLWNQFFMQSDAAATAGMAEQLPRWFAPARDSACWETRSFFQVEWLPVIGMVIFGTFFGQLSNLILGYGLFRVVSDMEKLPFPMAPIGAQGIMAMAEDIEKKQTQEGETAWRWRVFSIGGALGLAFGSIYLLLPTLSGALTGKSIQIFPIPFSDFTQTTGRYLPAFATGLVWDFGNLITGMVMPFFAMVGSFIGLGVTLVANPLLFKFEILHSWRYGDDTIQTLFKNNIDFYFSFGIGIAVAIAVVGFYQVGRGIAKVRAKARAGDEEAGGKNASGAYLNPSRGDIKLWLVLACYFFVTITYIAASAFLLRWHHGTWTPPESPNGIRNIILIITFLGFVYTPLISYVTARLEGMVGQAVQIPMVTESTLIFSGYRGVACWFLPMPIANYGAMTVFYRQCELTGTRFPSIWKTKIILYPIILLSSIFFMNFIWGLDKVPSSAYPYAEKMWELNALNSCIMYSSTLGEYSMFEQAFNWVYLGLGTLFGTVLFTVMSIAGAPIMMTYGLIRGLGSTMPHGIIPQFIGALIGRYYFQKRLGLKWRQYIPVVAAGFACGMGLITTVGVGITFLNKAVVSLPF